MKVKYNYNIKNLEITIVLYNYCEEKSIKQNSRNNYIIMLLF